MKTKILADFQICISVPLISLFPFLFQLTKKINYPLQNWTLDILLCNYKDLFSFWGIIAEKQLDEFPYSYLQLKTRVLASL